MKKLLLLATALLILLSLQNTARAQENFIKTYNVTYTVKSDATTHVVFNITLKNATSEYFATSYAIELGFSDIENLSAKDSLGPIIPVIQDTGMGKSIQVTFNKKAAGKNKTIAFQIAFDTTDIAQKQGNTWEVNIPGIANKNEFQNFTVHLNVPNDFGKPAYSKPPLTSNSFNFTKDMLGTSGVSLAFGNNEIYQYELTYHLSNRNLFSKIFQVALPPDTNYQHVAITNISPKPLEVISDTDGNWLAEYKLAPTQQLVVKLKGQAMVNLQPKKEILTAEQKNIYMQSTTFWETNDSQIQQAAKSLQTPQDIYDFVVHKLTYDFSKVADNKPRVGAAKIIRNPASANCLDFTDLFIALARAKGIPARELDGFAYTQNPKERPLSLVKDILHAWPEYYDQQKQQWIMVDPTWGNTTGGVDYFHLLDFDHLVFVIKGQSSMLPVPAGGYKTSDDNQKDIEVSFTSEFAQPVTSQQTIVNYPTEIQAGLPSYGQLTLENFGSQAIQTQNVIVKTSVLSPSQQTVQFSEVLPFGKQTTSFGFGFTPFLTNQASNLTIQSNGKTFTQSFVIKLLTERTKYVLGGIGIGISSFIIFIIAARARRLFVSRKK